MPDEPMVIPPEVWAAWGEHPCTQRLLARLDGDAAHWDEAAAAARVRAVNELDTHGGNLLGEREAMHDYLGAARTASGYATAIRKMFAPTPVGTEDTEPAPGPRRVNAKG